MDRTLVLVIILVTVVANVVVMGLALVTLRRRGEARGERESAQGGILASVPGSSSIRPPLAGTAPGPVGAAVGAAAASFAVASPHTITIETVASMSDRESSDPTIPSTSSGRWVLPPHDDPKADSTIHALVNGEGVAGVDDDRSAEALIDEATGFATASAWDEVFRRESFRLARYGRAVTVLVAELDGLDALAERLGQGPADRLIPPVAAAMRRNARAADVLARVGHTRFLVLLPETDEVAAINYVERVRSACDMWLEAGAVAVRLAIGWAQPGAGGRLDDALRLADERMNADRRRQGERGTRTRWRDPGAANDDSVPSAAPSATPSAAPPTPQAGDRPASVPPASPPVSGPSPASRTPIAHFSTASPSYRPVTAPPAPDGRGPASNGSTDDSFPAIDPETTYS